MTNDAMAMLMARAPQKIDPETSRKWHEQFYKDYPPPERRNIAAFREAFVAVAIAVGGTYCPELSPHPRVAWNRWYEECYAKFVND